ncbi:MAG: DUF559 domain-containing protein [Patescibacteria group bacterium]
MTREFIINKTALKPRRKQLRNQSTSAEKFLWEKLRKKQLGFWFKRQVSISNYFTPPLSFSSPNLGEETQRRSTGFWP